MANPSFRRDKPGGDVQLGVTLLGNDNRRQPPEDGAEWTCSTAGTRGRAAPPLPVHPADDVHRHHGGRGSCSLLIRASLRAVRSRSEQRHVFMLVYPVALVAVGIYGRGYVRAFRNRRSRPIGAGILSIAPVDEAIYDRVDVMFAPPMLSRTGSPLRGR